MICFNKFLSEVNNYYNISFLQNVMYLFERTYHIQWNFKHVYYFRPDIKKKFDMQLEDYIPLESPDGTNEGDQNTTQNQQFVTAHDSDVDILKEDPTKNDTKIVGTTVDMNEENSNNNNTALPVDYIIVDEINDDSIGDDLITVDEVRIISDEESNETRMSDVNISDDVKINCDSSEKYPRKSISFVEEKKTFSDYWNPNMDDFYEGIRQMNTFSVDKIHEEMSDDPSKWKIEDSDRQYSKLSLMNKPRCRWCREVGHIASKCQVRSRLPVCLLCGLKGHTETRCPEAACTMCGEIGVSTTYCNKCYYWKEHKCGVCMMYGHVSRKCPDLWRRYHLTVSDRNYFTLYFNNF